MGEAKHAAALAAQDTPVRNRGWFATTAFGPGLVHLLGSISPNDLIVNSVVGATYGYSLLWVLVAAYGLNYFIAEASSRYVLAAEESIMEGYGRLGRPVVLALSAAIFVRRHLSNLFLIGIIGPAVHMIAPLPHAESARIWSVALFAAAFALMLRGGYPGVEKAARFLISLLALAILAVVVMAGPSPMAIASGLLVPGAPAGSGSAVGAMALVMALAGTTVGSINHLKYPAFVFEKGWRSQKHLRQQRFDLAFSVLGQLGLSVLIQVAAAATLYGAGSEIRSLDDLAGLFAVHLGEPGRAILVIGFCAAVFNNYVGSNTGYSLIVADVYERFLRRGAFGDSRDAVRRRAARVLLAFFCLTPLYVLFTEWDTFWLGITISAMFLVLTPLLLIGLLRMTRDRAAMHGLVSGAWSQAGLVAAIAVSLYLTYRGALEFAADLGSR